MAESPDNPTVDLFDASLSSPNSTDIQSELWKKFGGAEGVAKEIFKEYKNSRTGSPYRAKCLQMIFQIMNNSPESEEVDLKHASEDELVGMLKEIMQVK